MAHVVQKPATYIAVLVITAACALAGIFSMSVVTLRLRAAPQVVAVDKAALGAALEASPWFALTAPDEETPTNAPVLWLLTALQCPRCEEIEARAKRLGMEVRVLATTPRSAAPALQAAVAEIARRRSGAVFQDWRARPTLAIPSPVGVTSGDVGPAALAGYAEWSHASYERLARVTQANGARLAPPALFWQRGREWRIAVKPDDEAFRSARRDLTAGR